MISVEGLVFIKKWEELRLEAYLDLAGIPTIGYGSLRHLDGRKVKLGDVIDEHTANTLLQRECDLIEPYVDAMVVPELQQNQMDALLSFCYNLGRHAFKDSTLRIRINEGASSEEIKKQWLRWNKARVNGVLKPVKGLTNRRKAEFRMWSGG